MNPKNLEVLLQGCDKDQVNNYTAYLNRLQTEKDRKTKQPKNPWMAYKKDDELARLFKAVSMDGLVFDGIDITLQSTGVQFSYQALKNKMFISYPESVVDVSLVYAGDAFNFQKNSGQVQYNHNIADPFGHKDDDIVGAYCVIKNKRGQFLTTLSRAEIDKHRKVAKTDSIWRNWLPEMSLKTVMKKACKQHFKDMFQTIETLDNESYNLEQPLGIEIDAKADIEAITTLDKLSEYWKANKAGQANLEDFTKLVTARADAIKAAMKTGDGNENI
jgi:hypothetical protein